MLTLYPFEIKVQCLKEHSFTNIIPSIDEQREIKDWLSKNTKGDYVSLPDWAISENSNGVFHCFFKKQEDAILFKLTWG